MRPVNTSHLASWVGFTKRNPVPAAWGVILTSKQIFARLSVDRTPLVRAIYRTLENGNGGGLRDDFFRGLLRRAHFGHDA